MRKILVTVLILLVLAIVSADIGPSPSFEFSIDNQDAYSSEYSFYYSGNIWEDRLIKITGDTSVYKLNTHIKIFAIPKAIEAQIASYDPSQIDGLGGDDKKLVLENSFVSNTFSLPSGKTIYTIASLDTHSKTLSLTQKQNTPDAVGGGLSSLVIIVIPIVILLAVILIVALKRKK